MADTQDFLLEIGTEDLPSKKLHEVAASLAQHIEKHLKQHALTYRAVKFYATPRRLAVIVSDLLSKQPDQPIELRGPAVKVAYDQFGEPTTAAIKFAASCSIDVAQLEKHTTEKGSWVVCKSVKVGAATQSLLPEIVNQAVKHLPIPKQMRWGEGKITFIRPVHWVVMLLGTTVIRAAVLGVVSDNQTYGHRFLAPQAITIPEPSKYIELLEQQGKVIPDFTKRMQMIREAIEHASQTGNALIADELLTEVTGLVEWPTILVGVFDPHFLEIPQEVLITVLQQQQRCFPVINAEGKLLPQFILVSNLISRNPRRVIEGNERVIRARLTDAEFFYRTDLEFTLDGYLQRLQHTVFQEKLGTMYDKTVRLQKLAAVIATKINADPSQANRAALLAKCDLMSTMVWEFPELQGIMGYYYALQEFEPDSIAIALKEQYLPRFAKDQLPTTELGCVLALADRADTLVGLFGINKVPTGEKDPLGLRRAATGILRIILEKALAIDLFELFTTAQQNYLVPLDNAAAIKQLLDFVYERLRAWYLEQGGKTNVFNAVLATQPTQPLNFQKRLEAVTYFVTLPEAEALSMAHKRVNNILTKAQLSAISTFNPKLVTEEAEKALAQQVAISAPKVRQLCAIGNYKEALTTLAALKPAIDTFFDKIMVMVEDKKIRNNRLALLHDLHALFILIADISLL